MRMTSHVSIVVTLDTELLQRHTLDRQDAQHLVKHAHDVAN